MVPQLREARHTGSIHAPFGGYSHQTALQVSGLDHNRWNGATHQIDDRSAGQGPPDGM
jgi:hypothetical protein